MIIINNIPVSRRFDTINIGEVFFDDVTLGTYIKTKTFIGTDGPYDGNVYNSIQLGNGLPGRFTNDDKVILRHNAKLTFE